MNNDARWIEKLIQDSSVTLIFTVKLVLNDLKKIRMVNRSVIKNGVLCLMALHKPVDFNNGNLVTLDKTNASRQNSKENHHFFPYSLASKLGIKLDEINSLLNFAFISKHLNLEISNKYPSNYLAGYAESNPNLSDHLKTHFIEEDAFKAALLNDFQTFIDSRGQAILNVINLVCHVNDNIQTTNSNLDENEDEILLDGSLDDDMDTVEEAVRTEPRIRMIPSNPHFFNLEGCFKKYGAVYWRQHFNFQSGDIAYMYITAPTSAILYKVAVEGTDLPFDTVMEREQEFYVHPENFDKKRVHNRMALLTFVEKTDSDKLGLSNLLKNGMNAAPQGVLNLSHSAYTDLLKYIEENF